MADELKHVLSFYKDEKQKQKLDILQTPDIYIDMRSTVKEVQQWLKAKQFSGRGPGRRGWLSVLNVDVQGSQVPGGDEWEAGAGDEQGGAGDGLRSGGGEQAGQSDHSQQEPDQVHPGQEQRAQGHTGEGQEEDGDKEGRE